MALDITKNFAKVTVSIGYAAGAVSIALQAGDGAKLPDPAVDGEYNLVWWQQTDYWDPSEDPLVEIVRVTARSGDTLTVTRAQEGTADSDHNTGGKVYHMILALTKYMMDEITIQYETESVTVDTTAGSYGNILVDATAADTTITLPSPTDIPGRIYTVKKTDSSKNSVYIATNGSETIDGETSINIKRQFTAFKFVTDGTNWFII